jgi:hypothetical protein
MQRTADFHHQIADAILPQAEPIFDDATALDTVVDMPDLQPAVGERLIGHVLLQRQLLTGKPHTGPAHLSYVSAQGTPLQVPVSVVEAAVG